MKINGIELQVGQKWIGTACDYTIIYVTDTFFVTVNSREDVTQWWIGKDRLKFSLWILSSGYEEPEEKEHGRFTQQEIDGAVARRRQNERTARRAAKRLDEEMRKCMDSAGDFERTINGVEYEFREIIPQDGGLLTLAGYVESERTLDDSLVRLQTHQDFVGFWHEDWMKASDWSHPEAHNGYALAYFGIRYSRISHLKPKPIRATHMVFQKGEE